MRKHFVGMSSHGALYESGDGQLDVHAEYVGQVIDDTPIVGLGLEEVHAASKCPVCGTYAWDMTFMVPAQDEEGDWHHPSCPTVRGDMVGAPVPQDEGPGDSQPHTSRSNAHPLLSSRAQRSRMVAQLPRGAAAPQRLPAVVPLPQDMQGSEPMWNAEGYYVPPGGGWFGTPAGYDPSMQGQPAQIDPEYLAEANALMDEAEQDIWKVGAIVMPWDVQAEADRQQKFHQQAQQQHHQQLLAHQKQSQQKPATSKRGSRQKVSADDPRLLVNQQPQDDGSQGGRDPNYDYSQDPNYQPGYPPPGYAQPEYGSDYGPQDYGSDSGPQDDGSGDYGLQDDGSDYGDDDGDYGPEDDGGDGEEFAAGAAPAGLGSAIGGIAGGALGLFAGSPEIGAPLGAALGGAIQGGVEQASQGHGGGTSGPGGGMPMGGSASRMYSKGGKPVALMGDYGPDGLFDPSPENEQDPERAALAHVVSAANDELRKLKPGTQWPGKGRRGGVDPRGAPKVAGFFDLPRYASVAEGWTEDQLNEAADWVADRVSGDPEETRYIVSGSSGASKVYGPYQDATIQQLLSQLPGVGMSISGQNPYDIDTHSHGVTLQATHNGNGTVTVSITGKNFYVSQGQVWGKLDGLMPNADA
jgi:hypothetical protein